MKAFKGFDKNLQCRGFQYKEGETFETDKADLCHEGFHACERPLDVFGYYAPADSVYHAVELDDVSSKRSSDDTKVVGKKIKIGARLSIRDLVNAQIEFVKEHCTNENNAEAGKPATAGSYGAATADSYGAATAGSYGAATAGFRGAATAGSSGAATAGSYGAATAGDSGAATAGFRGAATSRGKSSVGENGIACARGNGCMVRGGVGAILVIAEEQVDNCDIVAWISVMVDGESIKADTWYKLENGDLVEAVDDAPEVKE